MLNTDDLYTRDEILKCLVDAGFTYLVNQFETRRNQFSNSYGYEFDGIDLSIVMKEYGSKEFVRELCLKTWSNGFGYDQSYFKIEYRYGKVEKRYSTITRFSKSNEYYGLIDKSDLIKSIIIFIRDLYPLEFREKRLCNLLN